MKVSMSKSYPDIKCLVSDDNDCVLSIGYQSDHDIYVNMDKRTDSSTVVEYDKDFEIGISFNSEDPELYNIANELFKDVRIEKHGLRDDVEADGQIVVYSQEVSPIVGNYLIITKTDGIISFNFNTQTPKAGYDKDYGSSNHIPLRIINTHQNYNSFNRMYSNLIELSKKREARKKVLTNKKVCQRES